MKTSIRIHGFVLAACFVAASAAPAPAGDFPPSPPLIVDHGERPALVRPEPALANPSLQPIQAGSKYYHDGRGNFYYSSGGAFTRVANTTAYRVLRSKNMLYLMPRETQDLVKDHYFKSSGRRIPF